MVPTFPAICESVCGGTCPSVPYGVGATDRVPKNQVTPMNTDPSFTALTPSMALARLYFLM